MSKSKKYSEPFHIAVQTNNLVKVFEILNENKEAVNIKNAFGQTALHLSIELGYVDITECLINSVSNINEKSDLGKTALHYAITSDKLSVNKRAGIITKLIKAGADVNLADNFNLPPIVYALKRDQAESCELILEAGFNPNYIVAMKVSSSELPKEVSEMLTCFHHKSLLDIICSSSEVSNIKILDSFIKKKVIIEKAKYGSYDSSPLFYAAGAIKVEFVKLLLENNANPNFVQKCSNASILYIACNSYDKFCQESDILDIAKLLFKYGISQEIVSKKSNLFKLNVAQLAANKGLYEVSEFIENKGVNINPTNDEELISFTTPLHQACKEGDFNKMKDLLEQGMNPNLKDSLKYEVFFNKVEECVTALDYAKKSTKFSEEQLSLIRNYSVVHSIFSGEKFNMSEINPAIFYQINFDKITTQYLLHGNISDLQKFKIQVLSSFKLLPNAQEKFNEIAVNFCDRVDSVLKEQYEFKEIYQTIQQMLSDAQGDGITIAGFDYNDIVVNYLSSNKEKYNLLEKKLEILENSNSLNLATNDIPDILGNLEDN